MCDAVCGDQERDLDPLKLVSQAVVSGPKEVLGLNSGPQEEQDGSFESRVISSTLFFYIPRGSGCSHGRVLHYHV